MKRLIVFLVRRKLGLKKYEKFQFANQRSPIDVYYFTDTEIRKMELGRHTVLSSVSLNWLLSDECEIRKVKE